MAFTQNDIKVNVEIFVWKEEVISTYTKFPQCFSISFSLLPSSKTNYMYIRSFDIVWHVLEALFIFFPIFSPKCPPRRIISGDLSSSSLTIQLSPFLSGWYNEIYLKYCIIWFWKVHLVFIIVSSLPVRFHICSFFTSILYIHECSYSSWFKFLLC